MAHLIPAFLCMCLSVLLWSSARFLQPSYARLGTNVSILTVGQWIREAQLVAHMTQEQYAEHSRGGYQPSVSSSHAQRTRTTKLGCSGKPEVSLFKGPKLHACCLPMKAEGQ